MLPVSDQRVQGLGFLVDDNKLDVLVDLHTEADLGEGCVPVGRQLGLVCVKPSLPSLRIENVFVSPTLGIVVKGVL